jgi:hypothetical protein
MRSARPTLEQIQAALKPLGAAGQNNDRVRLAIVTALGSWTANSA